MSVREWESWLPLRGRWLRRLILTVTWVGCSGALALAVAESYIWCGPQHGGVQLWGHVLFYDRYPPDGEVFVDFSERVYCLQHSRCGSRQLFVWYAPP
jgi:hypothetical protein